MKQQRGMALITVLLLIALMMLLAVAGQRSWVTSLRRAETLQFSQQAKWTLLGAEQWLLRQPPAMAAGKPQSLTLEGETVHYRWRDKQNCFNLNALTRSGKTDSKAVYWPTAAQRVFAGLLEQAGIEAELAARTAQEFTARINPQNQPDAGPTLDDITQLRPHPLMTPAVWAALSPQLCVYPDTKLQINMNALSAAEIPLLDALFAGKLPADKAAQLLSRRPEQGWKDLNKFIADLPIEPGDAATLLQSVTVFASRERELQMWIAREQHYATLRSRVIEQDGQMKVRFREHGVSEE